MTNKWNFFRPSDDEPDESWRDQEPIRVTRDGATYKGEEINLDDPKYGFNNVTPDTLPDEVADDVTGRQNN
jgi:hypothetical protein